jgi:uncharacterized protein (TIGR02145 family)
MKIWKSTNKSNCLIFGIIFLTLINCHTLSAQVTISENAVTPDSSAMLGVISTNKGFLPPRMTVAQRDSITNPTPGLMIYCIDCLEMQMFNDTAWTNMIGLAPKEPWKCGDILSYDGKDYTTILLGEQCWMAENLCVGNMISGDLNQTDNNIIEKYCYGDNVLNCDTLGALYQWNEMMQYSIQEGTQGICPVEWHLPSDSEVKTLEMELGMSQFEANSQSWRGTNEGSKMAKDEPRWYDGPLDQNSAFDSSGFSVIPAGFLSKIPFSTFNNKNYGAYFWTSNVGYSSESAYRRYLYYSNSEIRRDGGGNIIDAYSVRCVKDE